jgi:osmotically inducible lipoprotein OsmB
MTTVIAELTQTNLVDVSSRSTSLSQSIKGIIMKNQRTLSLLAITAVFMLGGCAGMSRQEVSTVTGAAVGAMAGAAVGGPIATVGGAVVGGVVGNEVGKR